jgi:hypothetical protein
LNKDDGKLQRPFSNSADIQCRAYSVPLQRVVTDFGADVPFASVPTKLLEHYGITLPKGAAAIITEHHANQLSKEDDIGAAVTGGTTDILIAELDGSMIPIVETGDPKDATVDKRKKRKTQWQEAKLSLVRSSEDADPIFAVTLGDTKAAGDDIKRLALAAGFGPTTQVHALGDGAPWIAAQVEQQFGDQGNYLIDFYHLCEYLGDAAPVCGQGQSDDWLKKQKERFKNGEMQVVVAELEASLEPETVPDLQAPVRRCHRYITNRPKQFNYKAALDAKLPIGSGEVESAHRYVIQKRLKLPGAWWLPKNAQAMLNLRTLRANHRWDGYWKRITQCLPSLAA